MTGPINPKARLVAAFVAPDLSSARIDVRPITLTPRQTAGPFRPAHSGLSLQGRLINKDPPAPPPPVARFLYNFECHSFET